MQITVVGAGYVGLVTSVGFADVGHNVICIDKDPKKIKNLKDHKIPIFEPGLEDLLQSAKNRLQFGTELEKVLDLSEVIFIAVGTPQAENGSADLNALFNVIQTICKKAKAPKMIVIKSTVPVGTSKEIKKIIKANSVYLHEVINNPEFLKEGAAVNDFLRPDRVVIGCHSKEARKTMEKLYAPFVKNGHPILFMSNTAAELTKYAANSFLSIKISFANELAILADAVGADINEVRSGFTSDSRIHPAFFHPGSGYGGSCFPKDVQALIHTAEEKNCTMDIVKAAGQVNHRQKTFLADKVLNKYKNVADKTFAMWGLSFKPRTDDVREAPSGYIIEKLSKHGANIVAYDPIASNSAKKHFKGNFSIANSAIEACEDAHALLIVTEWNEFRNPDYVQMGENLRKKVIFDGRNALNPLEAKKHGFEYHCLGRQALLGEV